MEDFVVVASGYFDPLHVGHIEYLELAKSLAIKRAGEHGKLYVIVNNDYQAKLKKGKPFMRLEDRIKIVASLKSVDRVIGSVDTDESVCRTLEIISPTPKIFAKGGDRTIYNIPEREVCERLGIEIVDGLGKKIRSSSLFLKDYK
ncbi:cytidyltransferase [Candidatus Pacearchaeota archaeon]|nr:MAG: cytidyltransferase [Candidatus Pacearchaeota archaeon]